MEDYPRAAHRLAPKDNAVPRHLDSRHHRFGYSQSTFPLGDWVGDNRMDRGTWVPGVCTHLSWYSTRMFDSRANSDFFLSYFDGNETARPKWLFQTDLMDALRDACLKAGIVIPIYDTTDKFEARSFGWKKRPSITGYRLLVSVIALSFGTTKAYLSYTGNEAGSKGVEWAYGSIFSLL